MLIDDLFPSIHDIHAGQEIVEVFGVGQHFHSINVIDIVALCHEDVIPFRRRVGDVGFAGSVGLLCRSLLFLHRVVVPAGRMMTRLVMAQNY